MNGNWTVFCPLWKVHLERSSPGRSSNARTSSVVRVRKQEMNPSSQIVNGAMGRINVKKRWTGEFQNQRTVTWKAQKKTNGEHRQVQTSRAVISNILTRVSIRSENDKHSHSHKCVGRLDIILQNARCILISEVVEAYVENSTLFHAFRCKSRSSSCIDWFLNVRHILLLFRDATPFFVMGIEIAQNKLNGFLAFGLKLFIDLGFKHWGRTTSTGANIQYRVGREILQMLLDHCTCLRRQTSAAPPGYFEIPQSSERELLMLVKPRRAPCLITNFQKLRPRPRHIV